MIEEPSCNGRTIHIGPNCFTLDDFQEEAFQALEKGASVFVSAPTSSGKTLVAIRAAELVLEEKNSFMVYTSPLKALSNQKFREFVNIFGEAKVGLLTGDTQINIPAPIMIMTTEIYYNALVSYNTASDKQNLIINDQSLKYVVFDEIHYFSDQERGSIWELSLMLTPINRTRLIMLSATTASTERFVDWLRSIRDEEIDVIQSARRPVPLHYHFRFWESLLEIDFKPTRGELKPELIEKIALQTLSHKEMDVLSKYFPNSRKYNITTDGFPFFSSDKYPILRIYFSRARVESAALEIKSIIDETDTVRNQRIAEFNGLIDRFSNSAELRKSVSYGKLLETLYQGCAFHHAGLLPQLKECIEIMVERGLIPLINSTETFALGVNLPFKSVVFDELIKFDGTMERFLTKTELVQLGGRAGRRGIDQSGDLYFFGNIYTLNKLLYMFQETYKEFESHFKPTAFVLLNLLNNFSVENIINLFRRSYFYFCDKNNPIQDIVHSIINDLIENELVEEYKEKVDSVDSNEHNDHSIVHKPKKEELKFELTQKGIFASKITFQTIPITNFCFALPPISETAAAYQTITTLGCLMEHMHGKEDKFRQDVEIYLGNAHHRLADLPLPPQNRTPQWASRISKDITSNGTRREKQFHKKFEYSMEKNHLWTSESLAAAYFYKDVYDLIQNYSPESRLCNRLANYYNNGDSNEINLGAGLLIWLWIHEVPYKLIAEITRLNEGDLFQFYKIFFEILNNIRKGFIAIGKNTEAQFFQRWKHQFKRNILLPESLYLLEAGHTKKLEDKVPNHIEMNEKAIVEDPRLTHPEQKPDGRIYSNIRDTLAYLNAARDNFSFKYIKLMEYEREFWEDEEEFEDEEFEDDWDNENELDDEEGDPELNLSPNPNEPKLTFYEAVQSLLQSIEYAVNNGYSIHVHSMNAYMQKMPQFNYKNVRTVQKPDGSSSFVSFREFLDQAEQSGYISIKVVKGLEEVHLAENHPAPPPMDWRQFLETIISVYENIEDQNTAEPGINLRKLTELLRLEQQKGVFSLPNIRLKEALHNITEIGFLIPKDNSQLHLTSKNKVNLQDFLIELYKK